MACIHQSRVIDVGSDTAGLLRTYRATTVRNNILRVRVSGVFTHEKKIVDGIFGGTRMEISVREGLVRIGVIL